MAEIPKLVAHRLKAKASQEPHPDADLLAGFAEKMLRGREREQVVAHLSQCAECREIVFLAMPVVETAAGKEASHRQWLRWPALQWATAVACILIVGTAVMLRRPTTAARQEMQREPSQSRQSDNYIAKAPNPGTATGVQAPASAPVDARPAEETRPKVAARVRRDEAQLDAEMRRMPARAKQVQGNLPAGPAEYDKLASMPAQAAPAAQPAPSSSAGSGGIEGKAEIATGQKISTMNETVTVESAAVPVDTNASQAFEYEPKGARRASNKKAEAATMSMSGGQGGYVAGTLAKSENIWPHWTLTSEGVLQRSVDSGKSWQPITVPSGFIPRAVSAVGPHVWVGGTAGTLYHSSDLGEHWTQIQPLAQKKLAGDVIRIDFSDTQNGVLTTNTGETWRTADGGLHWRTP